MAYGTEYSRNQINEALRIENPYSMVPTKDEIGHGTMIAGIAAGNEVAESGFYGVATEADLVHAQHGTSLFRFILLYDEISINMNHFIYLFTSIGITSFSSSLDAQISER